MRGPTCSICNRDASQRVVKPSFITHRCEAHEVTETEANAMGWKLFNIPRQENLI